MDMSTIHAKIQKAKVNHQLTGEYADADWYRRANSAYKVKGVQQELVKRELGKRRRQERANNNMNLNKVFVDKAKEVLESSVFNEILEKAKEEIATDEN